MLCIQPEHGQQTQLFHLVIHIGVHPVQSDRGQIPLPGQVEHPQSLHMEYRTHSHHHPGKTDVQPFKAQQRPAHNAQQNCGQQQNQNNRDAPQHRGKDHVSIVGKPVVRRRIQRTGAVV